MTSIRSFEYVNPCYTGGNIYVYTGKLKNGNWFMTSDADCWLNEVNTDPDVLPGDEVWQNEWLDKHNVKAYELKETKQFYKAMYRWIIIYEPRNEHTNYSIDDMKRRLESINEWFPTEY